MACRLFISCTLFGLYWFVLVRDSDRVGSDVVGDLASVNPMCHPCYSATSRGNVGSECWRTGTHI